MAVDGISGNYNTYSYKQEPKEFKSTLDKDAFLKILVTQLKNQNPLEPTKDTEFIGQMAQFSSLEQSQNMNKSVKVNSASNMVNKLVKANYKEEDSIQSKEIIGLVEKIVMKDNEIFLSVDYNGKKLDIKFDDVTEVTELTNQAEQVYAVNQTTRMSAAFNLIGKTIKGKYETIETVDGVKKIKMVDIEGVVERVSKKGSTINLSVNGKDVLLEDVSEVKTTTTQM